MAQYSFTFDSVTSYKNAKKSGTIYNALITNASAFVSRTAISYVKDINQTLIDGVNIIVPRKEGGEVGDILLYKNNTYYWLKGNGTYPATSTTTANVPLGGMYRIDTEDGGLTAAGYSIIGFVGHREGNRCLIFYNNTSGLGTATWGPSGTSILTSRNLELGNGGAGRPMSVGLETVEGYYGYSVSEAVGTYVYPVSRSAWNAMVSKIYENVDTGWNTEGVVIGDTNAQGWMVKARAGSTLGEGTISVQLRGASTATEFNPEDYDYDFEKWYSQVVSVRYPSSKENSVMHEYSGQNSTAILNNASPTDYPIAAACLGYKVTGVSDFGEGKWWWPCMRELWLMQRNTHLLKAKGIDANKNYWSCSPSSSTSAWSARNYCAITAMAKTGSDNSTMAYLPVSEFYV